MANTYHWYANGLYRIAKGDIDLDGNIKVALFTSSETIDQDNETEYGTTNEVVGDGYTAGGIVVGHSVTLDTANKTIELRCTDADGKMTWSAPTTITARHAKLYYDGATKYLIGYCTFGDASPVDLASTNGTFVLDADDADGMLLKFTYS